MRYLLLLLFTSLLSINAFAVPNYHLVGALNTFLPGGGELLFGDYLSAGIEFTAETSTFAYGYRLSKRTPLTLDGVPQDVPDIQKATFTCLQYNLITGDCVKFGESKSGTFTVFDTRKKANYKPMFAAILQEFGIKYHMVNVFNSYRRALLVAEPASKIHKRDTIEIFKDPFRLKNLSNPWVYVPLALTA